MSGEAISTAAGAGSLIAGATPFGWAQLATQGLGALGSLDKPAGPSSSNGLFGSSQSPFDSSGWTVNFGNNASQDTRSGDRGGASLNPTNTASGAGGYSTAAAPGGSATGGLSMNTLYVVGGAVLLLLLIKRKG